jgi:hypothetical protein
MEPPPGFEVPEEMALRLVKKLYMAPNKVAMYMRKSETSSAR